MVFWVGWGRAEGGLTPRSLKYRPGSQAMKWYADLCFCSVYSVYCMAVFYVFICGKHKVWV